MKHNQKYLQLQGRLLNKTLTGQGICHVVLGYDENLNNSYKNALRRENQSLIKVNVPDIYDEGRYNIIARNDLVFCLVNNHRDVIISSDGSDLDNFPFFHLRQNGYEIILHIVMPSFMTSVENSAKKIAFHQTSEALSPQQMNTSFTNLMDYLQKIPFNTFARVYFINENYTSLEVGKKNINREYILAMANQLFDSVDPSEIEIRLPELLKSLKKAVGTLSLEQQNFISPHIEYLESFIEEERSIS